MTALHGNAPPFVSHAGNFEDVVINRVFPEPGFYIDVGGNDPVYGSVTWQLYQRGWHGIVLEPIQSAYKRFLKLRPRDITLCCAGSDTEGAQSFYVFKEQPALSTTKLDIARQHEHDYGLSASKVTVLKRTLASVIDEFPPTQTIDLLKIDAEGAEAEILRGANLKQNRPKLIVIEAMEPMRQVDASEDASKIIEDSGYILALEDGLNKFFVANEHRDLLPRLRYPANVFDNFISYTESVQNPKPDSNPYLEKANRRLKRLRIAIYALAASLFINVILLTLVLLRA